LRSEAAEYNQNSSGDKTIAFCFLMVFLMIAGVKNWIFAMKHYIIAKTLRH
jgi:hypothetical protein